MKSKAIWRVFVALTYMAIIYGVVSFSNSRFETLVLAVLALIYAAVLYNFSLLGRATDINAFSRACFSIPVVQNPISAIFRLKFSIALKLCTRSGKRAVSLYPISYPVNASGCFLKSFVSNPDSTWNLQKNKLLAG
jgi:hypothetical protein